MTAFEWVLVHFLVAVGVAALIAALWWMMSFSKGKAIINFGISAALEVWAVMVLVSAYYPHEFGIDHVAPAAIGLVVFFTTTILTALAALFALDAWWEWGQEDHTDRGARD